MTHGAPNRRWAFRMKHLASHPWDPVTLLRTPVRPTEVLRRCGRTFHAAARLLPASVRKELAVLYAFCRLVDDCGDMPDGRISADELLQEIEDNLHGLRCTSPIVADFRILAARRGIPLRHATQLLEGVRSDLGHVRMPDAETLIRYAYQVASTVGLMMCRVLEVSRDGDPFAIDLGIGMQLTNIARDVLEDAETNRVYLPATWVDPDAVLVATSTASLADSIVTTAAVERLLCLADTYYRSAETGMRFLPLPVRPAIRAAAANYRAIGGVIRREPVRGLMTRARTGGASKFLRSLVAVGRAMADQWPQSRAKVHDDALHAALVVT